MFGGQVYVRGTGICLGDRYMLGGQVQVYVRGTGIC